MSTRTAAPLCRTRLTTRAGNDKHTMLYAVYAYYYVPGTQTLATLMEDALVRAACAHCAS